MKFSPLALCKSSTPWLLGMSLIVCSLNEGHAAKPARPKPCASKMAQKATNRVTADKLNIGHTEKAWTMVAGEFILNVKYPDGEFFADSARIDIKINEGEEIKDPYSVVVGCSTFLKNEADTELPFHFGVISFDDKSGDATLAAVIVIDLTNKGTRLEPYPMPTSGLSMVNMLKENFSASNFVIKSIEIFKNSDSEIVIRSALKNNEIKEMEFITVQKFILN